MEETKKVQNKSKKNQKQKYVCKKCDYVTSRKYCYTRHLHSDKHKNFAHKISSKNGRKGVNGCAKKNWECDMCYKKYKSKSGLWKHKKICLEADHVDEYFAPEKVSNHYIKEESGNKTMSKEDVKNIVEVMMEYQKHIKSGGNTTMGDHNTVNSNNTQNISINLFLNEHCKNAMNLQDFVKEVKYTVQDVLNQQHAGYTKGIANVMVKNLKDLPVTERPIHCSDHKRGVFHVKDKEEGWVKEKGLEPGSKTMKACEKMNFKSVNGINTWQDENPNWQNDGNLLGERDKIAPKMYGPSDKYKANVAALKMVGEEVNIKDAIAEVSKNS